MQRASNQLTLATRTAATLKTRVLPAAEDALQAATRGFEAGKFGLLDVLDAQRTLLTARARHLGAPREFHPSRHGHRSSPRSLNAMEKIMTTTRQRVAMAAIVTAGIVLATAGPATLDVTARFPDEIRFDEDRLAHVVPRVGGVVERVDASLGQRVRAGDVLASISSSTLSRYGLSQVTAIFRGGTDIHFARQLVNQRLQGTRERLPTGIVPTMGAISTGLGEICLWTIEADEGARKSDGTPYTAADLREIQDWVVKPQLRTVTGVTEINSIGGFEKQYVVAPDLERLSAFGLSLADVVTAIERNHDNRAPATSSDAASRCWCGRRESCDRSTTCATSSSAASKDRRSVFARSRRSRSDATCARAQRPRTVARSCWVRSSC